MTIYLSEKDAARAGLTPKRTTRGRNTRPDVPSAPRSASTGLTTLLVRGWSITFDAVRGYRLYIQNKPAMDTGWQASELDVCQKAKALA